MNTAPKEFGEPSLPVKEAADLKRSAAGKPNLATAAAWVLSGILVVVVLLSVYSAA